MHHTCSLVKRVGIFTFFVLILSVVSLNAQDLTVGLFQYDSGAYDGYTLFAPLTDSTTYLIDMYGRVVHSWPGHYYTAPSFYLLENGNVLRCAKVIGGGSGKGGAVEEVTWDGTQVWFFEHHGSNYRAHHDMEPMPNGNILMVASETKTQAEILEAGRDSAFAGSRGLSVDYIIEVVPIGPDSGEIVWKWDLWDHFIQDYDSTKDNYGVVEEHPELADLNYVPSKINDQIHCNAVDYNPELDQIIISAARYHEIWIIDHSTTTEEAAGHTGGNCGMGGDILWRWGNPLAYRAGDSSDQKLYFQHDPRWIEPGLPGEGNILVFNNGQERPDGDYSSVHEIVPPVDENGCYPQPSPGTPHGPAEPVWTYVGDPLTDFYSHNISGAHRLPNGNTMICSGANGTFFEVTHEKEIVWKYINPIISTGPVAQGEDPEGNPVFRCHRHAPDYAAFDGHYLTPGAPLEIYPISITGTAHYPEDPSDVDPVIIATKITDDVAISVSEVRVNTGTGFTPVPLYDDGYHHDGGSGDSIYAVVLPPMPEGTEVSYYVFAENDSFEHTKDPFPAPWVVYSFVVGSRPPTILVNEVMADNQSTVQDEASDYDDWFELYNTQAEPLSLSGMYLTDDYYNPVKWPLPDTVIPPYGHLLFWADSEEGEGPLHTNFTLEKRGEIIGLSEPQRFGVVTVDWLVFEAQHSDTSFGPCSDGGEDWRFFEWGDASPGYGNYVCGDATADCVVNLSDVIYLARYYLEDGDPPPDPVCRGNADGENGIDVLDIIHIAEYYMKSGPNPYGCMNYVP